MFSGLFQTNHVDHKQKTMSDFQKKVLIVDDEAVLAGMLNAVFFNFGFRTMVVVSGKEAIRHLQNEKYDLVVLDWQLMDITGKEVLNSMAALPRKKITPIVLHSKEKRENLDIPMAQTFDVIEYWQKPLSLSAMCLAAADVIRTI